MKIFIYSFALFLFSVNLPAQNFQWAHSIGSLVNEPPYESLALDGNGNIYLAGSAVYAVNINGFMGLHYMTRSLLNLIHQVN